MQYLILGLFLINTGITLGLVAFVRYEADRELDKLRNNHLDLIFNLAREQGKLRADLFILESKNGKR
jgi:hypothetical protein